MNLFFKKLPLLPAFRRSAGGSFWLATLMSMPAIAQDSPPSVFQALIDCRSITDDKIRLACYDEKVGAFETAQKEKQVYIADKEEVRKTRRGVFGFTLPQGKLLGIGGDSDENSVDEIESTVKSARQNPYGKWVLTLEDGARWTQTDTKQLARHPRPGMPVRIRRASLSSFLASLDGQTAIRVSRVQ